MNESDRSLKIIYELQQLNLNIIERTINYEKGKVTLLFVKHLVDTAALSENVIKPIVQYCSKAQELISAHDVIDKVIYAYDCQIGIDENLIKKSILEGLIVILFSYQVEYAVINLKYIEHRSITAPELMYTIRGPRDTFVENLDINIALIRYRIKDPNLKMERYEIGERTKTTVILFYLEDVINSETVNEVKTRLNKINIDAVWGTGELQAFLQTNPYGLFYQLDSTERSDLACEAIVDGKFVIMADGGHVCLIGPHTFGELIESSDDRYDNMYFGLFSRIVRTIAIFILLCSSALYIALVSYHSSVLSATYVISIAEMRQKVLFTAPIEVLFVELIAELIREALLRVPNKIGTAIGIVGAIVIGQAATAAKIFSPLVLILVSLSLLASFTIPNYFLVNPLRILKYLVILLTTILGFYGFVIALIFIIINLVSVDSFNVPYLAPAAPFNFYDFVRAFIFNRAISKKRRQWLRTKNEDRKNEGKEQSNHIEK